ncbi:class I SAM-dependent methyltransferase [Chthonobacter rhizosphaerae]|uniref:class I SAM-dependent methyltransferase n=1 Tax=Chthonobacter rhizosphaerae TaxID=2735553 RepID=UPI001FE65930|nr:rRNA adenine N-6-methyltransferase family protein [Chthonobacter rhizosphaerae]
MRAQRSPRPPKPDLKRFRSLMADEVRFFRSWMGKPLTTGAVSPSGRMLAKAMASRIDPAWPGVVVELGPGTGAVTRALLDRGVAPDRIVAIEYNDVFADHLRAGFPGVRVIEGDAYAMEATLARHGITEAAAVVSSLPLFTRPLVQRTSLMEQSMRLMPEGRPFIQFSYALVPPLPERQGAWSLDVSDWIMMNLPPARVWTYRSARRS